MVSASSLLLTCDLENAIAPPLLTVAPTVLVTDAIALLGTPSVNPPVAANQDALNVPNSSGCVRCLVVMEDTQLVGLFSERDVTRLVADGQSLIGVPLSEVVEPPIVTIRQVELTTPDAALKLLRQHDIQHLPVLDNNGQVAGLLTSENLCRLLQPLERDQQLEQSIAELRLQIERSQLLMAVSARIRASLSLTETLAATVAEVRQFLGCDRVSIYRFNENQQFQVVAESLAANQRSFVGEAIHDPCFAPNWVAQYGKGRVRVVADIYTAGMTPCHIELLERLQIRAKILIPVIIDNQFWGLVSASESAAPRPWQPGEVTFLEELAIQVTIAIQQSQTATLLQQQRQELEMLLDRAPDIIFRLDRDLHYLYVNAAVEPMLGYTPEALIGQPSLVFTLAPDYLAEWMALTQRVAATGQEETIEYQLQTRTHSLWFQTRVAPEYGIDEAVTSFLCVARNITQRKQAEAKQAAYINILLEWQNRHHVAQQASGQVLYEWDTATDHVTWGINAAQVFGYSAAEMPQTSTAWFTSVHSEDLQWVQTAVTEYLEHRGHLHLRYRWQHQDGHYIWIEVQARFFADVSGNLTRIIGYITDISEKTRLEADRTQLETALRESEAQLRQIFDNSKDVFFLKSLDGKQMVYTSPAWEELYQTPLKQTYDNPQAWLDFVHPADRGRMSRLNQQMCQGETFEPCEYRIVRPDGSVRWLWTRTFPIRNETGEAYRVAGINTDITDRIQAEEALQKSQQRLRLAIQAAKIGYWQLDPLRKTLVASSQCKANFGLSPEDDFSYARLFELIHPDDRAHVMERMQQAIATHTDYQAEYRISWPAGKIHWIYMLGKATYNLDGSPLEMSGITLNISDRKQAEVELRQRAEALEESYAELEVSAEELRFQQQQLLLQAEALRVQQQRYQDLFDFAPDAYIITDMAGVIQEVNQAASACLGQPPLRLAGKPLSLFVASTEQRTFYNRLTQLQQQPSIRQWEMHLGYSDQSILMPMAVTTAPSYNPQGQITGYRWLGRNITEQKRIYAALSASEAKYRMLFTSIDEGFCIIELIFDEQNKPVDYRFLEISPSFEQQTGLVNAEGKRMRELVPNHEEYWFEIYGSIALKGEPARFQKRAEQLHRWYDVYAFRVGTPADRQVAVLFQDISDRKQAEAELRESEELNQRILESSQDSIKVLTLEGNLLYINAGGLCSLEDDSSLLANTNWLSLWQGDALKEAEAAIAAAKAGKVGRFSGNRPTLKGTPKWWDVAVTPLRDAVGQVIKLVVVSRDITEQKQSEVALRESEQTLSQVMNTVPGAVYKYRRSTNAADRFVFMSQGIVDLYEQTSEEILNDGSIAWDIILPEDVEQMSASIDRSAAMLEPWEFEFRIRTTSGVLKWILGHSIPYQQEDGSIIWCGILTDISDRKCSEQALRESEQRYRDLAEAMPQMVWLADTTGSVYYFNQRWYAYTGLSEAESMGLGAADAIHPDERDRTLQEWAQATTIGTLFELEYRLRHHEGLYRWFIVRGLPIQNLVGDIIGWVSTITDIDDFKRAVLAQQQSEARFRAVFEQAAVGIAEVDVRGRFLRGNQRYCDLLGYVEAELLERDFQSLTPVANELELDLFHNQQLLASEIDSFTIEKRMLCKSGELRWCQVTVSPVLNISGTIAYCLAVVQDIQDRKQAELARQASETRLNDVLSSAGASIGHFRFYENEVWETEYHSNGSEHIFGYAPDNFLAETWLSGIAVEDWRAIYEPMLAAIKAETEITLEYRFYHPDGSTRWISDTVTSRWHEDERCWFVTAIATNISDRKLAELALQQLNHELEARITQRTAALSESEMRYRALFEQAAVGISQCHPSGKYLQVNQRFCDLTGYAQAELLKMSWRDLIHPDDLTANQIELAQLYQGEVVSTTAESRYIRKDGQPQWVSFTISLLYDVAGAPISDLTVVEDISDRKAIERRLQTSEKRLKAIISKTVDGILILNPQGQILFGNPAAEKIFDCQQPYCQGALLGIPITLEKTFELDIPHRDGSLCTVEVRIEEITWQDKRAFLAAARDISQRKQDQIALQASELSYRTLAENLPGLVYKLYPSQNNKLVLFNDRLLTLCQFDPVDPTKQDKVCPMSSLIVPEDYDRVIETIQAAIANQQPFQIEYGIHIPTTQEKRYFLEQGSTVIDDIGQTLHIVGVIFDVTDTKQTEEKLRKSNEQLTITNAELARATRLKDEFLANMSHELRTPLNSVLGLSEVLQERTYGDLTEQQQRALTTIQTNGQHLLALINDILDLAKIESGKLELQMIPISVQQLCQSTIPFIQQQAFRKQISFSLNLASDLAYIEVDERLIRQALINLLINAVKFTPSGGSVTLSVEGKAAEQLLSFSVLDTGIGIAPENIDTLFQPFIQIDSSLSRRYSGTGLGLALVRRIVELHEGTVTVSSTVGQGSQFTVLLPWKHANTPNQGKIFSASVAAAKTDAKPLPVETQNAVKKPIVLLVEDNLDNSETLTAYLELKGFEIVVAYNGLQATQLAQAQSFNLILMDIQLPDMDGLEAICRIRSQEQDRRIPILAVTALAMPEDKEKCLAAGADDYLTKPISPSHLVSTMKKYLQLL